MPYTDTTVNNLVINVLTNSEYESITTPSDSELYLITDSPSPIYWGNDAGSVSVPVNADTLGGYSVNNLMKLFYPVGSVIQNTTNTNPSTYITGTTWTLKSSVALASNNVFGNGNTVAFTDGTNMFGTTGTQTGGFGANTAQYDKAQGAVNTSSTQPTGNKAIGIPTKAQAGSDPKTGIITDTITIYTFERTA